MILLRNILLLSCLLFFNTFNPPEEKTNKASTDFNWSAEGIHVNSFVENKGQFDYRPVTTSSPILYAIDHGMEQIYFTKKGVSYYFEKKVRNPDRKKGDRTMSKKIRIKEVVHFEWENANSNVEIIAENKTKDFHTYSFDGFSKSTTDFIEIIADGYKKLTYKNLYPNIDVEYLFHPNGGIKYNVILKPGADVSDFKMKYLTDHHLDLNKEGKIKIQTSFGTITEHEPKTFYANNSSESIASEFKVDDNLVSFKIGNYDRSKSIVIDPWVQTPTNANSNGIWEVEVDAAGNAYTIGGDSPMRLQKYNTAGVLQWTHSTPYSIDPDSMWLGSFATDQLGNSYISNGSQAAIQKVNTNGSVDWSNPNPALGAYEFWNITFNCDQSKLVIGGTGVIAGTAGAIFDIDVNNGNVTNSEIVTTGSFGLNPQEVRSISASFGAQYYFLSHDTIGAIHQDISSSPCSNSGPVFKFKIDHGYKFDYKCENYRPSNGNSGIMAIRANENFVYTQNGETLHKRSLADGSILSTVSIPGGNSTTTPIFNREQAGNSGIAIDNCGNVYVGSANAVIKYDADLTQLSSQSTSYRVFDVSIGVNGEILLAGTTGNNSSGPRTGYVQSINMNACAPRAFTCCDATICPQDRLCESDPSITLTPFTPGGTWSGPGITNASNGTFDPSVAGAGTHTITYTLNCGSDEIDITVAECSQEVCREANGDLTVSGGTAPYTWEVEVLDCSGCFGGNCIPIFCPGVLVWQNFSSGTTVTPPDFPVRVSDNNGDVTVINDANNLDLCSTDTCGPLSINISNLSEPSCFGDLDASFTSGIGGFSAPYEYTLVDDNSNIIANFTSSNTSENFNNLGSGEYTLSISDADNCELDTTFTLSEPNELTASISNSTPSSCNAQNGSATAAATGGTSPYTYSWSGSAGNSATVNNLSAGVYFVTVEDANGCTASSSVNIGSTDGPEVELDSVFNVSCPGADDGAIDILISGGTLPYSFDWTNGDDTQNISDLAPGTYSLTVIDANNCNAVLTAEVGVEDEINVNSTISGSGCDGNATISLTVSGGTPNYSFDWSTGDNTSSINNLSNGNYSVTITDANNCSVTDSFTIENNGSFSIDLTSTSTSCAGVNNGSISSSINGANPPLTYEWSNGATTSDLQNVGGGTYTVTVTDGNNCTVSNSETVTELNNISAVAGISDVVCPEDEDGGIKLTPFDGTEPYDAIWSNGSTNTSLSNLSAGDYSVTVTDSAGCIFDSTYTISSLSNYIIQASSSGLSCNENEGGEVSVSISGLDTGPFTYEWSTGDQSANVENLGSGTYTVTVTDSLNCSKSDTTNIFTSTLLLDAEIIESSCEDEADGAILVSVNSGTPPYIFDWANGSTDSVLTNLLAGTYELTVTDQEDCSKSETFEVLVSENSSECDSLNIYDVFSPNGDGVNDIWIIDGLNEYPNNALQIFNRWGGKVYEANPYNNDWNGENLNGNPVATGAYYYILELNNGSEKVHSGHINIIR